MSYEVARPFYPQDSTPVSASGHASGGAQLVVALPGAANKTTWLSKAILTTQAPATIQNVEATISDGTTTWYVEMVETVTAGGFANLDLATTPLPAGAVNTPMTVTIPAVGGGATVAMILIGYQI